MSFKGPDGKPLDFGNQPFKPHLKKSVDTHTDDDRPWMRPVKEEKPQLKNEDFASDYVPDFRENEFYDSTPIEDKNRLIKEELTREHESFFCGVCDHTSFSLESYNEHVVSMMHIERVAQVMHCDVPTEKKVKKEAKKKEIEQQIHYCEICDITCNADCSWEAHLAGAKHKKKEKQWLVEKEMAVAAEQRGIAQEEHKIYSSSETLAVKTQQEFKNYPEPLIGFLSFWY